MEGDGFTHFEYTLEQAIADGELVEILKHRWPELTGGKSLVATIGVSTQISLAGIMEIWNEYVVWRKNVMPKLPEEQQFFKTKMNEEDVFVDENEVRFLISYLSEY